MSNQQQLIDTSILHHLEEMHGVYYAPNPTVNDADGLKLLIHRIHGFCSIFTAETEHQKKVSDLSLYLCVNADRKLTLFE